MTLLLGAVAGSGSAAAVGNAATAARLRRRDRAEYAIEVRVPEPSVGVEAGAGGLENRPFRIPPRGGGGRLGVHLPPVGPAADAVRVRRGAGVQSVRGPEGAGGAEGRAGAGRQVGVGEVGAPRPARRLGAGWLVGAVGDIGRGAVGVRGPVAGDVRVVVGDGGGVVHERV